MKVKIVKSYITVGGEVYVTCVVLFFQLHVDKVTYVRGVATASLRFWKLIHVSQNREA